MPITEEEYQDAQQVIAKYQAAQEAMRQEKRDAYYVVAQEIVGSEAFQEVKVAVWELKNGSLRDDKFSLHVEPIALGMDRLANEVASYAPAAPASASENPAPAE